MRCSLKFSRDLETWGSGVIPDPVAGLLNTDFFPSLFFPPAESDGSSDLYVLPLPVPMGDRPWPFFRLRVETP